MYIQAIVNLSALQHNLKQVKKFAPKSKVLAMIKSDAYGHGLISVANAFYEADFLGVAHLEEAIQLRQANIKNKIVLMLGAGLPEELILAQHHNLEIVVHHPSQIEILKNTQLPAPMKVWLKIDTGMHRLGVLPEETENLYQKLTSIKNVDTEIKFITHLANAFNLTKDQTSKQIKTFDELIKNFPGEKSIANSAGIIGWPQSHVDIVRPGIMLYGVSPFMDKIGKDFNLLPVMTLQSKLIGINSIKKGEGVGYGGRWSCPENMKVGAIAIGYGDGYSRYVKDGTPILIRGKRCAVIGNVSMNIVTIDLRACPEAQINDTVTLWGDDLPVEEIASYANTIPYTLLCGVHPNNISYIE